MSRRRKSGEELAAPEQPTPEPRRAKGSPRWGALAGVVLLVPIALTLIAGRLTLLGAGLRVLAVLGAVLLLEALVLPACRWMVGPPADRREPPRR